MKTTPAQLRASNKYYEKNRGNTRLPATMLSPDEAALLDEMTAQFGTKKAALIARLQLLKQQREE
ncbi:TPA: hypothetical protein ACOP2N_004782 [Salmonella enterica]|nr:hypothetical protein [Salmonella enterica]EDR9398905.1 hypothetical protein [Salmonella enterica subsp. enterica]EDT6893305.1 hypothetical protein [Salmonella enterica subsp. enterica serovar Javiana]EDX5193512.1 hypothetical protein [Salmonella enterica subsp. enterica serovar Glostrup]EHW1129307.1 hypothetical protein [Salmonella enterica subsp. enterica serovar Kinondoni]